MKGNFTPNVSFHYRSKTPTVLDTNNLYELNFDVFQLAEGFIPLGVLHMIDYKTPQCLNIPILNTNHTFCSITKTHL